MLPALLIIGQNISGAFYTLLSRKLSLRIPNAQLQIVAVLQTVGLLTVMPLAWHWGGGISFSGIHNLWPLLLLAGVTGALNVSLSLWVFRYMDSAMGSLLMTLHTLAAIVVATCFMNEHMNFQQITGAALVLAAIAYSLSVHVGKRERRNWTMGIMITLLGAGVFAISANTEKYLLDNIGIASYLVWVWSAQWLFSVILSLMFGAHEWRRVLSRRNAVLLWGAGLTRSMMALVYVVCLVTLKNLWLVLVLTGLRPLFVSFLGAWVLRERKHLGHKIVASVVAAIGIAIMFW